MKKTITSLALLLGALWQLAEAPQATAASASVVVVMSAASGVKDISMADLRRAFLGLPTKLGGKRLIPLNLPPASGTRHIFDRAILGLEPGRVGAFWVDRRIRDESPPPRTVPSGALAARVAASLPGAIAYVPPAMMNSKVVALTIGGVAPGSPGYPLK